MTKVEANKMPISNVFTSRRAWFAIVVAAYVPFAHSSVRAQDALAATINMRGGEHPLLPSKDPIIEIKRKGGPTLETRWYPEFIVKQYKLDVKNPLPRTFTAEAQFWPPDRRSFIRCGWKITQAHQFGAQWRVVPKTLNALFIEYTLEPGWFGNHDYNTHLRLDVVFRALKIPHNIELRDDDVVNVWGCHKEGWSQEVLTSANPPANVTPPVQMPPAQSDIGCYILTSAQGPAPFSATLGTFCGANGKDQCWKEADRKNDDWKNIPGGPRHSCSLRD